jgi:trans-2,3-dihydro-3-hydroxyanthranilate isomerase
MKGGYPLSSQHSPLAYRHVDVFSRQPFAGNGLIVFPESNGLSSETMQRITQEMRQFESIFLHVELLSSLVRASIFTMEEELDFAGHPVLGAACVLHEQMAENPHRAHWRFKLKSGTVMVTTQRQEGWYHASMDQGRPVFGAIAAEEMRQEVLHALNLSAGALYEDLPIQMVSTGLPYLLIILNNDLEKAQITHPRFEELLAQLGTKFVYVFHLPSMEGRTWDNLGRVEDIATGSAAGPLGAYLVRYGQAQSGTPIILHEGSFVGRPSSITVQVTGSAHVIASVQVSGDVAMVIHGVVDAGV